LGRHGQTGRDVRKWRDWILPSGYIAFMRIDTETCYRALAARDSRFDGLFLVGVTRPWRAYAAMILWNRPISSLEPLIHG
jgi:hypothetical protein